MKVQAYFFLLPFSKTIFKAFVRFPYTLFHRKEQERNYLSFGHEALKNRSVFRVLRAPPGGNAALLLRFFRCQAAFEKCLKKKDWNPLKRPKRCLKKGLESLKKALNMP